MEAPKKAHPSVRVASAQEETRSIYEMDNPSSTDHSDLESNSERDNLLSAADEAPTDNSGADETPNEKDAYRMIRIQVYLAVLVANLAFIILGPAQTKIFEQVICLRWYGEHQPDQVPESRLMPEAQCKLPPIQRELASLRGIYDMFDAAPALLMSIPMGILMDIIGRRPLLLLGLCTITGQQFWIALVSLGAEQGVPIQLIWFGPLLNFISGGMMVLQMVFMCLITDITPRATLATALFRLAAVSQFCRVIGPVIAGGLMQISAWWAIVAGLLGLLAMIAISWTIPETMEFTAAEADEVVGSQPQSRWQRAWPRIKTGFIELKIVWSDWRLIMLVCLYPFLTIGVALGDVLQQYISNRYGWTLADATFLFSLQGVAATTALFVLLPMFSDFIERRFGLSAISLNVIMARISCSILALSYAVEGIAPNVGILVVGLIIETLGMGGGPALKALAASLVEQKDNGRVFSVLTIFEVLSSLMAYPSTAALLSVGFDKGGGIYLGLPFFLAAVSAGIACGMLVLARFERAPRLG